jgi:hypothetical protein
MFKYFVILEKRHMNIIIPIGGQGIRFRDAGYPEYRKEKNTRISVGFFTPFQTS